MESPASSTSNPKSNGTSTAASSSNLTAPSDRSVSSVASTPARPRRERLFQLSPSPRTATQKKLGLYNWEEKKEENFHDMLTTQQQIQEPETMVILHTQSATAKTEKDSSNTVLSSTGSDKSSRKPPLWLKLMNAFRCVFIDTALALSFALLMTSHVILHLRDNYWEKQLELETWNEMRWGDEYTYYDRKCTIEDQTAHSTRDLIVDPHVHSAQDAKRLQQHHGATIFPNLLTPATANKVRDFIVRQNHKQREMIYVLDNDNRYSFGIQVDQDPSVAEALEELLSNEFLVNALEALVGPDPAIIEFTGITSEYGAAEQDMHADVVPTGSAQRFARNFVPSYSLFIPLQNTTREMGATHFCPGTHLCGEGAADFCDTGNPDTSSFLAASGEDNNWPVGWGALVNQQTIHRGAAHEDPNGQERVVFILTFAPRPRWGPKEIETRILGMGGSYSLHWSQWGHALSDFRDSKTRMKFFWRHLRSLGLYLPKGAKWGWDFWTVTFQRIAQSELGYNEDGFDQAWEKNMGFIPTALRGQANDYAETDFLWKHFADLVTNNLYEISKSCYVVMILVFSVWIMLATVAALATGSRTSIWNPTKRQLLAQSLMILGAWLYLNHISQSDWAKKIQKGVLFNIKHADYSHYPELPATLVNNHDVLLTTEFQSDYLPSVSSVLDENHKPNMFWKELVESAYVNYDILTPSMKETLCKGLTEQIVQTGGRFLTKNNNNDWSALDPAMAVRYCHKCLASRANGTRGYLVRWTENLISEFQFGYWRHSPWIRSSGIFLLLSLQANLLGHSLVDSQSRKIPLEGTKEAKPLPLSALSPPPRKLKDFRSSRSSLPPRPLAEEPFRGAWFQAGDVVETRYKSHYDEWYVGLILHASHVSSTWVVEYDDGEVEEYACRDCVRRFEPYHVGEIVRWHDGESSSTCSIIRQHSDGSFDIKLLDGTTILKVQSVELSRGTKPEEFSSSDWAVGDRVISYYPRPEDGVFVGSITRISDEGEVDILDMGRNEMIRSLDIKAIAGPADSLIRRRPEVGDDVLAEFPGADGTFIGDVAKENEDGTFMIQYDDGDTARVDASMVLWVID